MARDDLAVPIQSTQRKGPPVSMISESKAAAKARVRAKVDAIKALPAAERIANTLHATHTTVEAEQLIAELRAETERQVRAQIAEDFKRLGNRQDSLSWGEAYYIARDGLCRCRGGSKPCDAESIREQVEGGVS